jgi:SAM-dependent methyltransferase
VSGSGTSAGTAPACPLCGDAPRREPVRAHGRRYHDCDGCGLVFVDPADRPAPAAERARYDEHHNDPADAGYRAFLERVAQPVAERVEPGAKGLDYGSGPGPALAEMLRERGYAMAIYDPFYAPDAAALEREYDFITCTETAEHFHAPAAEFARLDRMLRPGGLLAVMTEPRRDDRDLAAWWYIRDPTHVCFYRDRTFEWIARRFGWALERPARTVAIFRK